MQGTGLTADGVPPRSGGWVKGWQGQVRQTMAADEGRSRSRREARGRRLAVDRTAQMPPAEVLALAELQTRIAEEVLRLPEAQRQVILQRYFEGLNPGEIAERQGEPVGTIRKRLQRAIARLRERLEEQVGQDWRSPCFALAGGLPGFKPAPFHFTLLSLLMSKKLLVPVGSVLLLGVGAISFWPGTAGDGRDQNPGTASSLLDRPMVVAAAQAEIDDGARNPLSFPPPVLEGRLTSEGQVLAADGELELAAVGGQASSSVAVRQGAFQIPPNWQFQTGKALPSASGFRFWWEGRVPARPLSAGWRGDSDGLHLQLELGAAEGCLVRVSDLAGDPVVGASLRVGSPFFLPGDHPWPATDARGEVQLLLFGRSGLLRLQVEAEGYRIGHLAVPLDAPREDIEISLGKIFAWGFICAPSTVNSLSVVLSDQRLGGSSVSNDLALGGFERRMQQRTELAPDEWIHWEFLWEGADPLELPEATVGFGGAYPSRKIQFRPLRDPELEPLRRQHPADAPPQTRIPLRIRFEPSSALPDPPPESLNLVFNREAALETRTTQPSFLSGSSQESIGALGRWVQDSEYRFSLEPGTYEVGAARGGPFGTWNAPVEPFRLNLDEARTVTARMQDGARYLRCQFTDPGGFPIEINGLLVRADVGRSGGVRYAFGGEGTAAGFFQQGEYRLWSQGTRLGPTESIFRYPEDGVIRHGAWILALTPSTYSSLSGQVERAELQLRDAAANAESAESVPFLGPLREDG